MEGIKFALLACGTQILQDMSLNKIINTDGTNGVNTH
jgi:hypothetical protein